MAFNFNIFSMQAKKAYYKVNQTYVGMEEALEVFKYYFDNYECALHRPHPHISTSQIEQIITKMPSIELTNSVYEDAEPECYYDMIDAHFRTKYRNCDYNINHFFSGDIRAMRYYEVCY